MSRVSSETLRCNYRKLSRRTWTVDDPLLLTHANPTSRWINALRNRLATSQVPSTRSRMQLDECTGCNWSGSRTFRRAKAKRGSVVMGKRSETNRFLRGKRARHAPPSQIYRSVFTSVCANTPLINRSRKWIAKIDAGSTHVRISVNFLSFCFSLSLSLGNQMWRELFFFFFWYKWIFIYEIYDDFIVIYNCMYNKVFQCLKIYKIHCSSWYILFFMIVYDIEWFREIYGFLN